MPEEIDVNFLKNFRKLIFGQIRKGHRFIIITGGGKTCRKYQKALETTSKASNKDLDWMGIYTTWTNAQLIRLAFGSLAHSKIITDPNKKTAFKEKILLAGGWMPGRSTDDDAVRLAKIYGANTIINLSNIDFVYTKDPKKFKTAKKITNISWQGFRKLVGSKWDPGANVPFDPTAASTAYKNKQRVIITNGKNLNNLKNILEGKAFQGTVIS